MNELKKFKDAIEDDYFFEFLIDDLPLWGYIGEVNIIDYISNIIFILMISFVFLLIYMILYTNI